MKIFDTLKRTFGTPQIKNREDIRAFIESRSAFLVQKSIMEYAQARANMMFSTLMSEAGFKAAYEQARWASFPAGLSMVCEIVMGKLAAHGTSVDRMLAIADEIIAPYPVPQGLPHDVWKKARADLDADLSRASLAAPRPAHEIVRSRGKEIFDALPFHADIKQHDGEMFRNTLAFHLTEIATEMEEITVRQTFNWD